MHKKFKTAIFILAGIALLGTLALLTASQNTSWITPAATLQLPAKAAREAPTEITKQAGPDRELIILIHYPRAAKSGKPSGQGNTCPFKKLGKWPSNSLSYTHNPSGSGLDEASASSALAAAFGSWDTASGISITPAGTFTGSPSSYASGSMNGANEIGWASLSAKGFSNAIAITYLWRTIAAKQILEADIVYNNDPGFGWFTAPTQTGDPNSWTSANTGLFDLINIASHEDGHFIGLDHVQETEHTLYPYSATDEVKKRSLECGDIAGARNLYGA